jgi:hypothetical protein
VSLAGPRRDWEAAGRERRTYRCAACRAAEQDWYVPIGWLAIRVRDPEAAPGDNTYRVAALACSAGCLVTIAQRWAARVADSGAGGGGGR